MAVVLKYGILMGLLVVGWTYVMGLTGWYKDPVLVNLFWMVILIEIVVLLAALRKTAAMGATYRHQIAVGLGLASIAGVLVFLGSYVFTTVAFPHYFDDLSALQAEMMREAGLSDAEIQANLVVAKEQFTPIGQALQGFIGTVVTGILASMIGAIWIRSRDAGSPTAAA